MRILVVEDDRLLNNTLCYNLYTAGYVVDSVLTKSAASNFLTKQDYDLIVLDTPMPTGAVTQSLWYIAVRSGNVHRVQHYLRTERDT